MFSPSPRPLHPLISPKLSTLIMEIALLPAVSLLPSSPQRICWPGPLTATPPAAIQDPLCHRHPLGCPQLAGPQLMDLIVRRAFTSVQLRTILEENHHPFLIVEHNPQLYKRARDMTGHVAQAMKQAFRGASSCMPPYWTGTWKPLPRRQRSSASMTCRESSG